MKLGTVGGIALMVLFLVAVSRIVSLIGVFLRPDRDEGADKCIVSL